jgi:hypothetical protein
VGGVHTEGLRAQTDPAGPEPQTNYAFATQLGAGLYKAHGNSVQVYRLGFGIGLRSVEGHRWGFGLRVPVTFGFYDLKFPAALFSGQSADLRTISLVPELRVEIAVREQWRLMPFSALGAGRDFSASRTSYIAAAGIRSRVAFDWRSVSFLVGNRFLYSTFTTSGAGSGDDFVGLESGVDARHSLGFSIAGHRVDAGLFFVDYLYVVSPDLVHFIGESLSVEHQLELGFTLGTMTPWKVLWLELPRVGAAYRFGSGTSLVRIILGGPFN